MLNIKKGVFKVEEILKRLKEDITVQELSNYWPEFQPYAFAIYDAENVYIYNHPLSSEGEILYVKRDEQFNGCTTIMYEGVPTAIVDRTLYPNDDELYAILTHEIFHVHQHQQGESRFPNEILGMTYSLKLENMELRMKERNHLYRAVKEVDAKEKYKWIRKFIMIRESRIRLINEYVEYENFTETIEGPAWYVELQALKKNTKVPDHLLIESFIAKVIDPFQTFVNIRESCYYSGLCICLLLDHVVPDWKKAHFQTDKTLFEQLKDLFDIEDLQILEQVNISRATESLYKQIQEQKQRAIHTYSSREGTHVYIKGDVKVKGFDPMNVVCHEDIRLHKTFIQIQMNDQILHINQPTIIYFKEDGKTIDKLHLIVKEVTFKGSNEFDLEGIGKVDGQGHWINNAIWIRV